jgi:hypothetical protein
MAHNRDEHAEARVMRRIAFTGLGLALLGLSIVIGFSVWLAWGH